MFLSSTVAFYLGVGWPQHFLVLEVDGCNIQTYYCRLSAPNIKIHPALLYLCLCQLSLSAHVRTGVFNLLQLYHNTSNCKKKESNFQPYNVIFLHLHGFLHQYNSKGRRIIVNNDIKMSVWTTRWGCRMSNRKWKNCPNRPHLLFFVPTR